MLVHYFTLLRYRCASNKRECCALASTERLHNVNETEAMPNAARFVQSGTGATPPWSTDYWRPSPFAIGVGCVVNSSNVTYNVEHTFDPIFFPIYGSSVGTIASTTATWFQNSGVTAQSTNANGNYAFPVVAIRLNVTAGSSTGTVTMSLIQAGV